MRFVVVTGMSGAGKSTAIKMLEDEGYYCVDNLPLTLVDKFMELVSVPGGEISRAALGLDVRSDMFTHIEEVMDSIREKGYKYEILFMDADDQTLIRRYKETRRVHPLSPEGRVEDGIRREREILRNIKRKADYVIDTSDLLTRELKAELTRIFLDNKRYNSMMVTVMSFGFKHGIPPDADLVFDVRFLPNPYYVESLKQHTGNDDDVRDFVMSFPESRQFLDKLEEMITFLLPYYVREGKNRLVIGIGCTGGHHRSVTVANELFQRLKQNDDYGIKIFHRDINR